jgi:hypothetical protein
MELAAYDTADAVALGLDPDSVLSTATDKARRDAPASAVCDV